MWKKADKGYGVESLQEMLKQLDLFPGEPDGFYGAGTEKAVALFQEKEGLRITGVADDETLLTLAMRCAVE